MFGALLKLDVEEALGARVVTEAAGSVRAGRVVDGGSVSRAACPGATLVEAGSSSRITGRLAGVVSLPPSSPEGSTAATPESVIYSARYGISISAFRMFCSLVCVDSAGGPEADSCESGGTGLELTTSSSSPGVVLRRVVGPGAPGSPSYVINSLLCAHLHIN